MKLGINKHKTFITFSDIKQLDTGYFFLFLAIAVRTLLVRACSRHQSLPPRNLNGNLSFNFIIETGRLIGDRSGGYETERKIGHWREGYGSERDTYRGKVRVRQKCVSESYVWRMVCIEEIYVSEKGAYQIKVRIGERYRIKVCIEVSDVW